MSKPISEEELQLKVRARRRIIGAVTLVVLMVIFLPMIFDAKPKSEVKDVAVEIPDPKESALIESPTLPQPPAKSNDIPRPPESAIAEVKPFPPEDQIKEAKPIPSKPEVKDEKKSEKIVEKPKAATKPQQDDKKAEPVQHVEKTDKKTGKYFVQVGAFSNPENAEQVEAKLENGGVQHTRVKLANGVIKIKVGPFVNKSEAEAAQTQLKLVGVTSGVVIKEAP